MTGKPLRQPPQYTSLVGDQKYGKTSSYRVSISASIFSILIYISVFYIFNLSPSVVFNSSKFWFFLSNTLIIIIAVDYGSFSSCCDSVDDPYDEHVAKSRQPMSAIYHQPNYTHTTPVPSSRPLQIKNAYHDHREGSEDEDGVVEVKNMIFSTLLKPKEDEDVEIIKDLVVDETWTVPTQDSIWESISKEADEKIRKENTSHRNIIKCVDHKARKRVKTFRRTVSEKLPEAMHIERHERKNVIHRWESEGHDQLGADNENEEREVEEEIRVEDQFAAMTDEELNRRVEEFIQKFNRHIRLERNINF